MGSPGEITAVFLQVRLDSSRLPGKALLPLAGRSVIVHAMDSLAGVSADVYALLTDDESAPVLQPCAEDCGFDVFPGPRDDVLRRFAMAAETYRASTIVRATGDNPLVSRILTENIIHEHWAAAADYSGFIGMPLGTGVEVLKAEALYTADREAADPYEREHVSPFLYRRPERFRIHRPSAGTEYLLKDSRVTLDTREDYAFLQFIYDDLYGNSPIETDELVRWLKRHQSACVEEKVSG